MLKPSFILLFAVIFLARNSQGAEVEGPLKPHLTKPHHDLHQVFKGERFGNIVVSMKGTVIATWGTSHVRAKRSEDGGKTWGPEIVIAKPGFQTGGLTVNETNGDIIAFVEDRHPPAPIHVFRSSDDGKSWKKIKTNMITELRRIVETELVPTALFSVESSEIWGGFIHIQYDNQSGTTTEGVEELINVLQAELRGWEYIMKHEQFFWKHGAWKNKYVE